MKISVKFLSDLSALAEVNFRSKAITRTIALSLKFALVILTHKRFFPIRVKRARASLGKFIVCIVLE